MRLIVENESIKLQNFVEYLIENYKEKGKTYDFEIHIEDRYDKKLLENREHSLKNKILVLHTDGFEVLESGLLKDLTKFKEELHSIIDDNALIENFTEEHFQNQFVHYKIRFIEHEHKHQFDFSYLNLQKT